MTKPDIHTIHDMEPGVEYDFDTVTVHEDDAGNRWVEGQIGKQKYVGATTPKLRTVITGTTMAQGELVSEHVDFVMVRIATVRDGDKEYTGVLIPSKNAEE